MIDLFRLELRIVIRETNAAYLWRGGDVKRENVLGYPHAPADDMFRFRIEILTEVW